MSNLKKKIGVGIIGLAMLATAFPAFSMTAEELAEQIAALEQTLAGLMDAYTDLAGDTSATTPGTTGTIPAACVGISFDRNLSQGASGNDVKCLQAILNLDAATQVAASGIGSPGQETVYFGPLTTAAVVKMQEKYAAQILTPLGLTAGTGFVGNSTRTVLNAMLQGGGGVTPLPPTELQLILQQLSALAETVSTLADRVAVLEGTAPGAEEGYMEATLYAVPADSTVYQGTNDNSVYGFKVEASLSDVTVQRVTLKFNKRPWLYTDHIALYEGSNKIAEITPTASAFEEVTAGSDYNLHLTGLNVTVPSGTSKIFTVKVNVPSLSHSTGAVTVRLIANGVRGVDGAAIQQYAPSAQLGTRTFTIASADTANLEVSLNTASPNEGAIDLSTTSTTEGVELAMINLKAKNSDVLITQLILTGTNGTSNGLATVLPAVSLYDGDNVLQTVTGGASMTFSLTSNPISISKDATKTLTVKADVAKVATSYTTAGDYVRVALTGNATNITAEDANYTTLANANISGTATGNYVSFYDKTPELALVSTSIKQVSAGSSGEMGAEFSITLSVTALGGDIYIAKFDATTPGFTAAKQGSYGGAIAYDITSTANVSSNANFLVGSGETKSFTVSGWIPEGTAGMEGAKITDVRWNTDDGSTWTRWNGAAAPWQSIPIIFKTNKVYVTS